MKRPSGSRVFTLLVAAYVLAVLAQTPALSPVARLVPLWVLCPVLALLALEWVLTRVPRVTASSGPDRYHPPATPPAVSTAALLPLLGWYALLPLLVACVDLRWALGLYTFCAMRWRAGETVARALVLAVAMAALAAGASWVLEGG